MGQVRRAMENLGKNLFLNIIESEAASSPKTVRKSRAKAPGIFVFYA